jgi:hypothetical protein
MNGRKSGRFSPPWYSSDGARFEVATNLTPPATREEYAVDTRGPARQARAATESVRRMTAFRKETKTN